MKIRQLAASVIGVSVVLGFCASSSGAATSRTTYGKGGAQFTAAFNGKPKSASQVAGASSLEAYWTGAANPLSAGARFNIGDEDVLVTTYASSSQASAGETATLKTFPVNAVRVSSGGATGASFTGIAPGSGGAYEFAEVVGRGDTVFIVTAFTNTKSEAASFGSKFAVVAG